MLRRVERSGAGHDRRHGAGVVIKAITANAAGSVFVGGYTKGQGICGSQQIYVWGQEDIFVAGLSSDGEWEWAKSSGSSQNDFVNGIAIRPGGLCTVAGRIGGSTWFGINNGLKPLGDYESFFGELSFAVGNPDEPLISIVPSLLNAYPNPFAGKLNLCVDLKQADKISVKIYNLKGQLVRKLIQENKAAGNHNFSWDGLSDSQKSCAAGIYLVQIKGAKTNLLRKVLKY